MIGGIELCLTLEEEAQLRRELAMADDDKQPEGSRFRDYRGTRGAIDDAEGVGPEDERRRNARGRTGVSRPVSPRTGVRYVDPDSAREGEEGEPAYGAPLSTPPPSNRPRPEARPDPLKKKDDDDE